MEAEGWEEGRWTVKNKERGRGGGVNIRVSSDKIRRFSDG